MFFITLIKLKSYLKGLYMHFCIVVFTNCGQVSSFKKLHFYLYIRCREILQKNKKNKVDKHAAKILQ